MAQEGFWCPTLIDEWRAFLRRGIPSDNVLNHRNAFVSNIGYNLQYLEFLNYQIKEVELHATVYSQTLKSFVISGMGIIEAIMWYLLKKNDLNRREDWEKVAELTSQAFNEEGSSYRVVNYIQKKLETPVELEMPLHWMLKRVEKKKLLGIKSQAYKDLNYLRNLRNKVHIHVVQHDTDTDWNAFNNNELKLTKKALHGVLNSELFSPKETHIKMLEFLAVEETTEQLIEEIPF